LLFYQGSAETEACLQYKKLSCTAASCSIDT
jgi:hypothetical protein